MPDDGPGRGAVPEAVERGDLDELSRLVDGLCSSGSWAELLELRDRCDRAVERGRQLWPAARHAEYRLSLEAPGPWAAGVLVEGAGRFTPGPLPEVAASTHGWREVGPHLEPGPAAVMFLHERVVRGEDLTGVPLPGPDVLELPPVLQPWEPRYALATYRSDHGEFPAPATPRLEPMAPPPGPIAAADAQARARVHAGAGAGAGGPALAALVETWRRESEATVAVSAVAGPGDGVTPLIASAVGALEPPDPHGAPIGGADAMALMAWAAASGGVHGRRRGAAVGRLDAWMVAAALGDVDGWPLDPAAVGAAVARLRWSVWDPGGTGTRWSLHLAVEDPDRARAWAISARDSG